MAERSARGHVLLIMVLLLGFLAELAADSLRTAAHDGIQALAETARQGRDARAEAIAVALEALPVPSAGDRRERQPWHPASAADDMTVQGCAGLEPSSDLTSCAWPVEDELLASAMPGAPGWHWQLRRLEDADAGPEPDGTDHAAFPQLRPQRWQLQVVVTGRDGQRSGWRYDYLQQAAP